MTNTNITIYTTVQQKYKIIWFKLFTKNGRNLHGV